MDYKEKKAFLSGLLIGALAGAIVSGISALLMAPYSGEATRQLIRAKSNTLRSDAEHRVKDAMKEVQDSLDKVDEAVTNWIEKGNEAAQKARKPSAIAGRVVEKVLE
jgi:gas vesicle protein